MNSKTLTFKDDNKKKLSIKWVEGVCENPDLLTKVLDNRDKWTWEGIKTTGNTLSHLPERRHIRHHKSGITPIKFLGLQTAPKIVKIEKLDAEGKVKAPRKKMNIDVAKMKELAEAGKTTKEASVVMGISYANIFSAAKKAGIEFKKGQRGKPKKGVVNAKV